MENIYLCIDEISKKKHETAGWQDDQRRKRQEMNNRKRLKAVCCFYRGCDLRAQLFSDRDHNLCVGMCFQLLVIGGQVYRVPSISADEWEEKNIQFEIGRAWPQQAQIGAVAGATRENVLKQFRTPFVKDKFDLDAAIQTKVEFSCAIVVMDRIGGWKKEMNKIPSPRK